MVKTCAPFVHSGFTCRGVYLWALVAFAPPLLGLFIWQIPGATNVLTCLISTFVAQLWLNYRTNQYLYDFSSMITGLVLALMLPLDAPTWLCIIASAVAIFGAKALFGGTGRNWINPACGGVALTLLFPTVWGTTLKEAEGQFLWGYFGGSLGEISTILLLIGAGFLVWKRLASWKIFLPYLAGVVITALFLDANILAILAWGGTMFGAFYLSADPVTSPVDSRWHYLFGLFGGVFATSFAYFFPAMGGVALGIICTNLLGRLADFLSFSYD